MLNSKALQFFIIKFILKESLQIKKVGDQCYNETPLFNEKISEQFKKLLKTQLQQLSMYIVGKEGEIAILYMNLRFLYIIHSMLNLYNTTENSYLEISIKKCKCIIIFV